MDETGHKENGKSLWTWCFRAERYTLFKSEPSRGSDVLIDVLGRQFDGVRGCDYFSAYRKYMKDVGAEVQFCLAHLIRDVKFLTTLPDAVTRNFGQRLLDALRKLFRVIHRRQRMTSVQFQRGVGASPPARVEDRASRSSANRSAEPGGSIQPTWRRLLPIHHDAGDRADEQPG